MKKILFLHGFFSSGSCPQAEALREALEGEAEVISPDLPYYPRTAVPLIKDICEKQHPDLIVGNSCGAFYAQMVSPVVGIPALLGNPHFRMSEFLSKRIGEQQAKFPRTSDSGKFTVDSEMVDAFFATEAVQFDCCDDYWKDRIWGLFGDKDTLAGFEDEFLEHYSTALHFPGNHTPTPDEVKKYYAPAAMKMMEIYPVRGNGRRYFRHFKGGLYRMEGIALDSETLERMVVYKALYGEGKLWVRPETMFFESIEREGKRFRRFSEIEKP